MSGVVVALDGPSGSGKSTVGRHLATTFHLACLDTGAMFRAVAWGCLADGVDLTDHAAAERHARELDLTMGLDPDDARVWVREHDITAEIRTDRITAAVSEVATNLGVRAELKRRQRALIEEERTGGYSGGHGILAEGRDITTVVAPDADVRILLVAGEEARLRRRALETLGRDDAEALEATRALVVTRDQRDSTVSQFLTPAEGVTPLDSSTLSLAETLEAATALVTAGLERLRGE